MAWGAKTNATQLTGIVQTEQFFSVNPLSTPGELFHIEVEFNPPATPVDELVVAVYGTLDDSAFNWDDTPLLEFEIANSPDPNKVSFQLTGVYRWRVGVIMNGATDTGVADLSFREDNVSQ